MTEPAVESKLQLGQVLQKQGLVTAEEIEKALDEQKDSGHRKLLGELLVEMGVSPPQLEILVAAAKKAGALGAKLSGGGRGGNMIALTKPDDAQAISQALVNAGAVQTIITVLEPRDPGL